MFQCKSWWAQLFAAAAAKSLQSCPTLWDPIDSSPPGSSGPGILQARTLEWVAISFSNAGKWKVKVKSLSCARLLATAWTTAYQAPPSMGFSRQEYWSGVPLPSPQLLSCVQLFLCDPMDWSPSGPSVHGILWARTLEWGAISSSGESSQSRGWTHMSCVSCIAGSVCTYWASGKALIGYFFKKEL